MHLGGRGSAVCNVQTDVFVLGFVLTVVRVHVSLNGCKAVLGATRSRLPGHKKRGSSTTAFKLSGYLLLVLRTVLVF